MWLALASVHWPHVLHSSLSAISLSTIAGFCHYPTSLPPLFHLQNPSFLHFFLNFSPLLNSPSFHSLNLPSSAAISAPFSSWPTTTVACGFRAPASPRLLLDKPEYLTPFL